MLITKIVKVKWGKRNKKYYKELGYKFTNFGDEFEVKIKDLSDSSPIKVEVLCDYCLKEGIRTIISKPYYKYKRDNVNAIIKKDCCNNCKGKKIKESNLIVYGVESIFLTPNVKSATEQSIKNTRLDFSLIENKCKELDYILITKKEEYKNAKKTPLYFICKKHKEYGIQQTTWSSFKYTSGCKYCGGEKISGILKEDGKIVYDEFIKLGYEPQFKPEDYIGCKTKLPYICPKHRDKGVQYKSYAVLKNKPTAGCKYCNADKHKGKNAYNWKGGISSKEERIRKSVDYKDWRKSVFERDNYTCQCCGDKSGHNLEAHHIKNFSDNKDKRFDINNAITLCNKCHNPNQIGSFHHMYGTHDNNREQLEEYIQKYNVNL